MSVDTDVWLFVIANFFTFIGYIMYALTQYTKLKQDVEHLKAEFIDLADMKTVVYKIYAQNEILLGFNSSSRDSSCKL